MMELFDKKFVHFMWDDELEGKIGFFADDICELTNCVHSGSLHLCKVGKSISPAFPFKDTVNHNDWLFFYYDPNYEVKRAVNEGKVVQYLTDKGQWETILSNMELMSHIEKSRQLRVKPEEKKWIAYLSRSGYLTACREDIWEQAQKEQGAKTKLFVGSAVEATAWYESRQKFAPIIKAWEDGKTIQFYSAYEGDWRDDSSPRWKPDCEYRIKPEEKKYRPYNNSAEMIADFIVRFKVNCPPYAEPLIWIKGRETGKSSLVIGISRKDNKISVDGGRCSLSTLFTLYTYLDGSPVGMEVKE